MYEIFLNSLWFTLSVILLFIAVCLIVIVLIAIIVPIYIRFDLKRERKE